MEITVSKDNAPEYHRTVFEVAREFNTIEEMQVLLEQLNFAAKHINPLYGAAQKALKQDMKVVEKFVSETTAQMKTAFLPGTDPKKSLYDADPILRDSLDRFATEAEKAGTLPLDDDRTAARVLTDTLGRSTQFSSFDIIPAPRMQLMAQIAIELAKSPDALEKSQDGVTVQVKRGDKGKIEGFTVLDSGKTYKFGKFMLFDTVGCFKPLLVTCDSAPQLARKTPEMRPLPPASSVASSLVGAINPQSQLPLQLQSSAVAKAIVADGHPSTDSAPSSSVG